LGTGGIDMKGVFGDLFDFDRDGELDCFEQAAEFMFFYETLSKEDEEDKDDEEDF
jgi:hypothetical protein